jgi:hypothetical protein
VAHRDQAHYVASETDFRHRRKRAAFSHGASRQVAHREKSAMIHVITLSELAAVIGMVLGTAGFVMGLMNYLRDKPRIKVSVNWNMVEVRTDVKKGMVVVANVGRRPTR